MGAARIVSDPRVMMGKPVVEGTRITVELILEKLAAGETVEQIVAAHPSLTEDGVRAALEYAARVSMSLASGIAPFMVMEGASFMVRLSPQLWSC